MLSMMLWASGCGAPVDEMDQVRAPVRALEAALAREPLPPGPGLPDGRFRPTGVYRDGNVWWTFSDTDDRQIGVPLDGGPPKERRGPAGTRRCVVTPRFGTVCVGFRTPGGVVRVGNGPPRPVRRGLPDRGGFSDVAWGQGALWVVDAVGERLWTVPPDRPTTSTPLWPGAREVLLSSKGLVIVADQTPYVAVLNDGAVRPLRTGTPVRDAVVDEARGLVWTVGPADRPLVRTQGWIEGLYTTVTGYALDAEVPDRPVSTLDFRSKRLVDGVAIRQVGDRLAIAAAASNAVWLVHPDTRHDVVVPTSLGPQGMAVTDNRLVVAGRLDDRLTVVDVATSLAKAPSANAFTTSSIDLIPPMVRRDPVAVGELLFAQRALWSDDVRNDFTCDSCHWNGLTDHRMHPGFLEQRREATRPVAGMRGIAPAFSPMQSATVTDAVEGLVSSLDLRYWTEHDRTPFLVDVALTVPTRTGTTRVQLSPEEVRRALVAYVMTLSPAPGPLREPDGTLRPLARRGLERFLEDCAGCHEPVRDLRTRVLHTDVPTALTRGPLVFGAPLFARVGVEPTMTPSGTRISPLVALDRGGPYFTNGSARTLREVIDRTDPTARRQVHAAPAPVYDDDEREALTAFLLSL